MLDGFFSSFVYIRFAEKLGGKYWWLAVLKKKEKQKKLKYGTRLSKTKRENR